MRLIRVYAPGEIRPQGSVDLEGTAAAHVSRVLRLRIGDPVTLFNGDGWEYPGTISASGSGKLRVEVGERVAGIAESPLALTLVQGIARGERMDMVMQKATELGVARIVPLLTERSVVRLDARQGQRKLEHWKAVTVAACEQSGRSRLPVVEAPVRLGEWLEREPQPARCLTLAPGAAQPLREMGGTWREAALLIGPEGGLTDAEQASAAGAGYQACSLGRRVLRTETAALAALAVLQAVHGDLG
jgi:16S rRNA (uracil1498-N3)-methyltransferase